MTRRSNSPCSRRRWPAAALVCATLATSPGLAAQPPTGTAPALSADGCPLAPGPTGVVARVIDGDSLSLADGTEVRLIGALAARPAFATRPWRIEIAGKAVLEALVVGKTVELGYAGKRTNRYGQSLAHVFVETEGGAREWVQGRLIEQGFARAYGLPENFGCMRALRARERIARDARRGLWGDKAFAPMPVEPAQDLRRLQSTFQVVRGDVRKVERVKNRVYLNFGEDWRQDFTAGASLNDAKPDEGWAGRLSALQGRTVEVRGWIERRNGPFIAVWDESQIEVVAEP